MRGQQEAIENKKIVGNSKCEPDSTLGLETPSNKKPR